MTRLDGFGAHEPQAAQVRPAIAKRCRTGCSNDSRPLRRNADCH